MRYKTAGPTAGAADTETQVGGADIAFSQANGWTIKKIKVSYAHVVDAKSAVGALELKIDTLKGPFKWIIGSGAGGAATTSIKKADVIDVNIPISGGSKVGAYVTFADAAADVQITLGYVPGNSGAITFSDMPALTAALSADTRATLGAITTRADLRNAFIQNIRVGLGAVVNAKASSVKIEVTGVPDINSDELIFTCFGAAPGATNSGPGDAETTELNFPVPGNTAITPYATAAEAAVESGYSIQYTGS